MSVSTNKTKTLLPVLAVLGSMVSLVVGTSFGKSLFPAVGAQGTATFRVVFAAAILLAVWRPWRMPISKSSFAAIAKFGATLGLMNVMFYMAIGRLPLGIAIAIEFTGPLLVAIASSHKIIDFVWIALAVVGLLLLLPITPNTSQLDPVGIACALAAAALWALYIILGKRLGNIASSQATSIGMLTAAVVVLPIGFAHTGMKLLNPALVPAAVSLAILSSCIPYSLEVFALKNLPKNTFGILLSMEPALGAVAGAIILHEHLTVIQCVAIASVMIASIGTSLGATAPTEKRNEISDIPADVL